MHGSRGSRLASLSGLERSATAAEEEGRKGQIERIGGGYLGAVYHGQVEKYFEKGGGGQIMNCGEFTSASVDGKE